MVYGFNLFFLLSPNLLFVKHIRNNEKNVYKGLSPALSSTHTLSPPYSCIIHNSYKVIY